MLIEEGVVIKNSSGREFEVRTVTKGLYGLFLTGFLPELGRDGAVYLIPELAPQDCEWDWYGWSTRSYALLPDGRKIGALSLRNDEPWTLEAHDQRMKETWDTIRKEEQE